MASRPDRAGVVGVVLAGGRSSRFGSDKLAAPVEGVPLLHHALLRLVQVTDELIVVLALGAEPPVVPADVPVRFVHDDAPDQGPLEGALAGLSGTDAAIAILVGGDMPELSTSLAEEMVRLVETSGTEAVALRDGDRVRPLPLVVRVAPARSVAWALRRGGERRLRALQQGLRTTVVEERDWHALDPSRGSLRDIDEPADIGEPPT